MGQLVLNKRAALFQDPAAFGSAVSGLARCYRHQNLISPKLYEGATEYKVSSISVL